MGKIHTWKENGILVLHGARDSTQEAGNNTFHRRDVARVTRCSFIYSQREASNRVHRRFQEKPPTRGGGEVQPPQQLCRGLKRYQGDFRGVWLPTGIRGMRLTLEFHRSSRAGGWGGARSFPSRSQLIETGQVLLGPNLTYVRRSARNEHAKETAIVRSTPLRHDKLDWRSDPVKTR